MLLALDTSTAWLGIALRGPSGLAAAASWHVAMRQSACCVAEIEHLLSSCALTPSALSGIAVALGPGGFTSLRVGLSVAKGLALALGRPIVGIGTLPAMVHPHALDGEERAVGAVLGLGRGEIVAQWFAGSAQRPLSEPVVGDARAVAELAPRGPLLVVAELDAALQSSLAAALGARATFAGGVSALSRAASVAALGWSRLARGEADHLARLQPLYPQRSGQPTQTAAG